VGETGLIKANVGLTIGGSVSAGTVLNVPGVSYHVLVAGETDASVASQHGITVAGLHAANPGVSFAAPLVAGTRLLIPSH
jgi:LysM repeat protein